MRRQLGGMLRRHREHAGLSGEALGEKLGRSQSWVSKVELGKIAISEADVTAWADATAVDPEPGADLVEAWDQTQAAFYLPWSDATMVAGGATAKQFEIRALEATCTRLAEFQPALVPGLLQTPGYAMDVVFAPGGPVGDGTHPDDAAGIVQQRIARQQILWTGGSSGKTCTFVMLAAALHTRVAGPDVMRGQLAHLAAMCEGPPPGVTVAIVPFEARVPFPPTSGFALYDEDLVVLEGPGGGEVQVGNPAEVAVYQRLLQLLLEVAVTGSEAAALCRGAVGTP